MKLAALGGLRYGLSMALRASHAVGTGGHGPGLRQQQPDRAHQLRCITGIISKNSQGKPTEDGLKWETETLLT